MTLQEYGQQLAQQIGLPWPVFNAWINQESGWNPNAVSNAGAQGIAQFMPGTASDVGLSDPFDPFASLKAAANLLQGYHNSFGSWPLALGAYNAGAGAVNKYGGVPPYAETQNYVNNIWSHNTDPTLSSATTIGATSPNVPQTPWQRATGGAIGAGVAAGQATRGAIGNAITGPLKADFVDIALTVLASALLVGGLIWLAFSVAGEQITGAIKESAKDPKAVARAAGEAALA